MKSIRRVDIYREGASNLRNYAPKLFSILVFCALISGFFSFYTFDTDGVKIEAGERADQQLQWTYEYTFYADPATSSDTMLFIPNASDVREVIVNNVLVRRANAATENLFSVPVIIDFEAYTVPESLILPGHNTVHVLLAEDETDFVQPQIFRFMSQQGVDSSNLSVSANRVLIRGLLYGSA